MPFTLEKGSLMISIKQIKVDGLSNIFYTRFKIVKAAWILLMIVSLCFCCQLIVKTILEYISYKVITNYRFITETTSTFPMVTFCNQNPFNSKYYVELLQEANITAFDVEPYAILMALEDYKSSETEFRFTIEQIRRMFDEDGFVISCTFQNKPCNPIYFRYLFHPYRKNCIQFNSGFDSKGNVLPLLQASVGGEYNELTIELYVGLPDEIASLIPFRGAYVTIRNSSDDPFKNAPLEASVTPGFGLKFNVVRNLLTQFNDWPYTYSQCNVNKDGTLKKTIKDRTLFDFTLSTNFTYAQDSCFLYCSQYYSAEVCNCSAPWSIYQPSGYRTCTTADLDCFNNFYYLVFTIGDFIQNNCLDKCPLECQNHHYQVFQSMYAYPEPLYLEQTLKNVPMLASRYSEQADFTQRLESNVVKFSVYYDALSYKEVREEAQITWYGLLATIGGHLHLFLGMSLLSFIEIGEVVFQLILFRSTRISHFSIDQIKSVKKGFQGF